MSQFEGLSYSEAQKLLSELRDWIVVSDAGVLRLRKTFKFSSYEKGLKFVNALARVAEQHNHHPHIILEWGKVTVAWWTHSVDGLLPNDFFMASRTDSVHR